MSEAVQSDLILGLDIKYKNVKLHNDGTVEHLETLLPMIFIIFIYGDRGRAGYTSLLAMLGVEVR